MAGGEVGVPGLVLPEPFRLRRMPMLLGWDVKASMKPALSYICIAGNIP